MEMFGNLRPGCKVYILRKSSASISVDDGIVETTSNMPMMSYYQQIGFPVDISVRIGEKVATYQRLPSNAETAEGIEQSTGESVIVACGKDAIIGSIQDLRRKSVDHISSVGFHEKRIASCDSVYNQLNPDAMMKAKRDAEIQSMRTEMENMRRIIDELKHTSGESSQQANKHEYDNKNAQRI